jgi:hypothetical protein
MAVAAEERGDVTSREGCEQGREFGRSGWVGGEGERKGKVKKISQVSPGCWDERDKGRWMQKK